MTDVQLGHVILPLPRPQYVTVPEALIVALAWQTHRVVWPKSQEGLTPAILYKTDSRSLKTIEYRASEPTTAEQVAAYAAGLQDAGLSSAGNQKELALAAARSIAGIKSRNGRTQAATPFTPALALLQNMEGLQGSENPPPLGKILELLYQLGLSGGEVHEGVAKRWAGASGMRLDIDPLIRGLDQAVAATLLPSKIEQILKPSFDPRERVEWQGLFPDTPFSWFVANWNRITRKEWVEALPPRVWVDWATTVLRLALGMGYLWEAAWYETVARHVLRGERRTWEELLREVPEILPWRSRKSAPTIRDVAPLISWRVRRSRLIREHLESWLEARPEDARENLTEGFQAMSDDPDLRERLEAALGNRQRTTDLVYEAVTYTLKTREGSGDFVDYYGLLQSTGRYLRVDPGIEWIAVVASLTCASPSGLSDVAALTESLSSLGLRPELPDLISLLERAGLARGSADADQGVVVQSAF